MGTIKTKSIIKNNNTIRIDFEYSSDLAKYFKLSFYEFSIEHETECIPDGIAVIPFVCNVLPLVWLTDSDLVIQELDESFMNSINEFKKGYINMYPMLEFKGSILCSNARKYNYCEKSATKHNSLLFFSGGVDAYSSLIAHLDEKPLLVTINGADIKLSDTEGWNNVCKTVKDCCIEFGLQKHYIISNFREILNEIQTSSMVSASGDGWWHGFQHGIGLIGHASVLCYIFGIKKVYIASSYTDTMKGLYTCASDPTIDNYVRFINTRIFHDQYDYSRQDKIHSICNFVRQTNHNINLRVCWVSSGGKNCCHCEKCYRTMVAILAEGMDSSIFALPCDSNKLKEIKSFFLNNAILENHLIVLWKDIQSAFCKNFVKKDVSKDLQWILTFDFDKVNNKQYKRLVRISEKYPHIYKLYIKFQNTKHVILDKLQNSNL